MKMGIVGTGMIVRDLMQVVHQVGIEQLAIFGRNHAKTQRLAEEYGIARCFSDYPALLASDMDTIYIAVPNHLHFTFAEQALRAGKHVILEKPITAGYAEFLALRELAGRQKKLLIEAVTVHYLPAYRQLKQEIGKLGQIKILSLNYSQYSSRYDRFKNGDIAPVFDPQQAGGALMDLNVYNLHFAVGLFGAPKSCFYSANIERNIDTSGILLLDYGTFQAVCIGAKDCQAPVMLSIQGDKGNITVPMPANQMHAYRLNHNNGDSALHEFEQQHRMRYEFQEFVRMIDHQDTAAAEKMLDISAIVCQLTETARRQAGIVFNNP